MDNDYVHVTQALSILRKLGLEYWFRTNSAEFCDAESKKSKEIGTLVHEVIQKHIEKEAISFETKYPQEVKNCLESFFLFKKDYPKIKLKQAEQLVTSKHYGYCGTLDCLAKENGELMIIDWKSGKCEVGTKKEKDAPPVYPEHEYQVSAYVNAYNEQSKANISKAGVLVLAKDKVAYNYRTIVGNDLEEMFNEVFLPALKIYNYQNKNKNKGGSF